MVVLLEFGLGETLMIELINLLVIDKVFTHLLSGPNGVRGCGEFILFANDESHWHVFDLLQLDLWSLGRVIMLQVFLIVHVVILSELLVVEYLSIVEKRFDSDWHLLSIVVDSGSQVVCVLVNWDILNGFLIAEVSEHVAEVAGVVFPVLSKHLVDSNLVKDLLKEFKRLTDSLYQVILTM